MVQSGTHEELILQEGLYRRLCQLQFREAALEAGSADVRGG